MEIKSEADWGIVGPQSGRLSQQYFVEEFRWTTRYHDLSL